MNKNSLKRKHELQWGYSLDAPIKPNQGPRDYTLIYLCYEP